MNTKRKTTKQPAFKERANLEIWLAWVRHGLTAFFILTLPIVIYLPNSEYGYTKTIYAYLMVTLLWGMWAVQAWRQHRWQWCLPAMLWPLVGLIGAGALSLINAISPGIGLQSLGVFVFFTLVYFYIANHAKARHSFYLYLGAGVLSALLASLYGVLQHGGWLPGLSGVSGGKHAMISAMGNSNFLAEFLDLWLIPTFFLYLVLRNRWVKLVLLLMCGLCYIAFTWADSIGAWLGFLLGGLFFVVALVLNKPALRLVWRQKGWVALWLVVFVGLFAVLDKPQFVDTLLSRQTQVVDAQVGLKALNRLDNPLEQIASLVSRFWEAGSGNTRAWDWWVAYEMLKANPVFGVGLGHYKVLFVDYKIKFLQTERGKQFNFQIKRAAQAHNDYVQAAAEMGGVGIAAMGFAVLAFVWQMVRQIRLIQGMRRLAVLSLYAGIIAFLSDAAVNFPVHLAASAFSAVFLLGLAHAPFLWPGRSSVRFSKWGTRSLVIVLLAAMVVVSVFAYRDWQANIYLDYGNKQRQQGRYQLAREAYEKSLALDFQPAEVLFRLGTVYQTLGDLDRAEHYFERSMNSFLVEETFLPLAVIKLQKKDFDEATRLIDRLLATKPNASLVKEAELLKAVVQMRRGNLDQATEQLNRLLEKYPNFERVYLSLGEVSSLQGDYPGALAYYQAALNIIESQLQAQTAQWKQLQGQQVTLNQFEQLRSSIERNNQLRAEVLNIIEQLSARLQGP